MEHGTTRNGELWDWLCHVWFAVAEWLESKKGSQVGANPALARLIVVFVASSQERVDTTYRKRADFAATPVAATPVARALQSVHFSLTFARVTNPVGGSFAGYS